jgi:hypothetical protein
MFFRDFRVPALPDGALGFEAISRGIERNPMGYDRGIERNPLELLPGRREFLPVG